MCLYLVVLQYILINIYILICQLGGLDSLIAIYIYVNRFIGRNMNQYMVHAVVYIYIYMYKGHIYNAIYMYSVRVIDMYV